MPACKSGKSDNGSEGWGFELLQLHLLTRMNAYSAGFLFAVTPGGVLKPKNQEGFDLPVGAKSSRILARKNECLRLARFFDQQELKISDGMWA